MLKEIFEAREEDVAEMAVIGVLNVRIGLVDGLQEVREDNRDGVELWCVNTVL